MLTALMGACLVLLVGCGSDDPAPNLEETQVGSASVAKFTIKAEKAPSQGKNDFELSLLDAKSGAPIEGATITVTATMPAMGDGSDGEEVMDQKSGNYHIMNVNFMMAGQWKVAYKATKGDLTDEAAFSYEVP
jgi:YtkA-like